MTIENFLVEVMNRSLGSYADAKFEVQWTAGDRTWLPYDEVAHLKALADYLEAIGVDGIENLTDTGDGGTYDDDPQVSIGHLAPHTRGAHINRPCSKKRPPSTLRKPRPTRSTPHHHRQSFRRHSPPRHRKSPRCRSSSYRPPLGPQPPRRPAHRSRTQTTLDIRRSRCQYRLGRPNIRSRPRSPIRPRQSPSQGGINPSLPTAIRQALSKGPRVQNSRTTTMSSRPSRPSRTNPLLLPLRSGVASQQRGSPQPPSRLSPVQGGIRP